VQLSFLLELGAILSSLDCLGYCLQSSFLLKFSRVSGQPSGLLAYLVFVMILLVFSQGKDQTFVAELIQLHFEWKGTWA